MSSFSQQDGPIYSVLADDPDLYDLVKMFVDEMPSRLEKLLAEFNSKNWDGLKNTAHQLKGAAGSYGFAAVTPAAAKLEDSLKQSPPEEAIQQMLNELIATCQRMSIAEPDIL